MTWKRYADLRSRNFWIALATSALLTFAFLADTYGLPGPAGEWFVA